MRLIKLQHCNVVQPTWAQTAASRATAAAEFMATPPESEGQHDLLQDPWKGEGLQYARQTSST